MRRVKGPKPGELRAFEPTSFGNAEVPEADRVRVWIRNPTEQEKREATSLADSVEFVEPEGDDETQPQVRVDMRVVLSRVGAFVRQFVEGVDNYEGPAGETINDGETLLRHGETPIVLEVADEVEHATSLSEAERKNSERPSVCSVEATPRSAGIVPSANDTASTKTAIATEPAPSLSISQTSGPCIEGVQKRG